MKKIILIKYLATLLVASIAIASPSFAFDVYLVAQAYNKTIDLGGGDTETIPMWGFAKATDDTFTSIGLPSSPGPRIVLPPGGTTLTITLLNNLPEPVSIVIPGQTAALVPERDGSGRVFSLTHTTEENGTETYTWNGLEPGTYIYHSGTNLAKQVHMGLYGAVTKDAAAGQAYPGLAFTNDNEVVLFYSEIDPDLHALAKFNSPDGFAHSNDYKPRYFLINGEPYMSGAEVMDAGSVNQPTLVRMLSTALGDLVPTILGMPWELVAEDGNLYPYPRTQHTTLLSAMKTKDAIITPSKAGTFTVFDRRGSLTNDGVEPGGMMAQLEVVATGGTALDDPAITNEETPVTIDVLFNDSDVSAVDSVTQAANGAVVNNVTDVTYTPNPNFTGSDAFTYRATNGTDLTNWATVTVTVTNINDPPMANPDAYEVAEGGTLNVLAPGVLGNDSDPDGDALTAEIFSGPTAGSFNFFNENGSFEFSATGLSPGVVATFVYLAKDALLSSPATVTITVMAAPANQPPVAEPDFATTTRNTAKTIDLAGNDSDPDGNLDPTSVEVAAVSSRGGTITNLGNGSVVYTPRRNFRGTDTFTYEIWDEGGELSDSATVTVNVVK